MKEFYKTYEIEITSQKDSSGRWIADATTTPEIGAVRSMTALGDAKKGGFASQQEAETAALDWAKMRIDQKID